MASADGEQMGSSGDAVLAFLKLSVVSLQHLTMHIKPFCQMQPCYNLLNTANHFFSLSFFRPPTNDAPK